MPMKGPLWAEDEWDLAEDWDEAVVAQAGLCQNVFALGQDNCGRREGLVVMKGRCRKSVGIVTLYGGHTAKEVYRLHNGEGNRYGGVEGVRTRRAEIDEGHICNSRI